MADHRIDQLCDAARAAIQAAIADTGAVTPIAGTDPVVSCVDAFEVDPDQLVRLPAGKLFVSVRPVGYEDDGAANRREDATAYTLAVLVHELAQSVGPPGRDWRKLRTQWVHQAVVKPLGDPRTRPLGAAVVPMTQEVEFDLTYLHTHKLFVTLVTVRFREEA